MSKKINENIEKYSLKSMIVTYMGARYPNGYPNRISQMEAIQIMDDYHSDDESLKADAYMRMLAGLWGWLQSIIKDIAGTFITAFPSTLDDFEEEVCIALIAGMRNYNPQLTAPTSYFNQQIRASVIRTLRSFKYKTQKSSFSQKLYSIEKAREECRALLPGVEPDAITISMALGDDNKMSVREINGCLQVLDSIIDGVSIDASFDGENEIQISAEGKSTEAAAIDSLIADSIMDLIETQCSELEKLVIQESLLSPEKKTHPEIVRLIQTTYPELIDDKKAFDTNQVRYIVEKFRKKAREEPRYKMLKDKARRRKDDKLGKLGAGGPRVSNADIADAVNDMFSDEIDLDSSFMKADSEIMLGFGPIDVETE